jgi:hypothetical protein
MSKVIDFTELAAHAASSTRQSGRAVASAHARLRRRFTQIDHLTANQAAVIEGIWSAFLKEHPMRRSRPVESSNSSDH